MEEKSQRIDFITTTSLVVGNRVGAIIFLLPATLVGYGSISLIGWLFTLNGSNSFLSINAMASKRTVI